MRAENGSGAESIQMAGVASVVDPRTAWRSSGSCVLRPFRESGTHKSAPRITLLDCALLLRCACRWMVGNLPVHSARAAASKIHRFSGASSPWVHLVLLRAVPLAERRS